MPDWYLAGGMALGAILFLMFLSVPVAFSFLLVMYGRPLNASNFFGHAGQCDQVLSCIRPLDAASQRAAGQYGDTRTRSKSIFRALSPDPHNWFPRPRLNDRLPLPVLRPAHIHHAITSGRSHSGRSRDGVAIAFLLRHQRPGYARHPVGHGHGNQPPRLAGQHAGKP